MVVDVVLAVDVIAGVLEDVAHGVAERGPTTVADVQRAGGVGRDELVVDLEAVALVDAGEVHALLADGADDLVVGGGVQVEVDEAGASDLDLGDGGAGGHVGDDGLGDLGGSGTGEARGSQGDGGSPLTVVGVGRSLDAAILDLELSQVTGLLGGGDCLPNKLLDRLGHVYSFSYAPALARTYTDFRQV